MHLTKSSCKQGSRSGSRCSAPQSPPRTRRNGFLLWEGRLSGTPAIVPFQGCGALPASGDLAAWICQVCPSGVTLDAWGERGQAAHGHPACVQSAFQALFPPHGLEHFPQRLQGNEGRILPLRSVRVLSLSSFSNTDTLFHLRDTRLNKKCDSLSMRFVPVAVLRGSFLPGALEIMIQFLSNSLHWGESRWWLTSAVRAWWAATGYVALRLVAAVGIQRV